MCIRDRTSSTRPRARCCSSTTPSRRRASPASRRPTSSRSSILSLIHISEQVKDVHYRAAVALDENGKPIGLVTRSDLVSPKPRKVILVDPRPRRVLLVDHAEAAQSVPGVEEAEIVEILDHHHLSLIHI